MSSLGIVVLEPCRIQGITAQQPCPTVQVILVGAGSQPEGHRLLQGDAPWGMPFTAQLLFSTLQPNQTCETPSEASELPIPTPLDAVITDSQETGIPSLE